MLDLVLHRLCPVEEYNELFSVPVALFAAPNRELLQRLGGLEGLHRAAQVVDALFLVLIVDVVLGVDSLGTVAPRAFDLLSDPRLLCFRAVIGEDTDAQR